MSRKSRQNVRLEILKALQEKNVLSYTQIQRTLSTNYNSVKENCKELEIYGLIQVKTLLEHPRNKHPSFIVSLTEVGRKIVNKIKKE